MQSKFATAVLLGLMLAGCVDTTLPVTEGRIGTADEFLATAAGKTVRNSNTTLTIARNGTISGVTHGNQIAGTWEFREGFWCRTITAPTLTEEDCQVWEIAKSQLVITRAKGTGEVLRFDLPRTVGTAQ